MHRVRVELELEEEGQAGRHQEGGADDHELPVRQDPMVDGGQRRHLDRVRLARGRQEGDQRREERQARQEGDDHADTGDQAELGDAPERGRQEGEESRQESERGQRQRPADPAGGLAERRHDAVELVALVAVAHRDLDAEVDPEPEEERRDCDGDHVEAPDHQEACAHREDEPGERCRQHRGDDPAGFQRQVKDDRDGDDRQPEMKRRRLLDRGELLVSERRRARQPNGHAVVRD